VGRFPEVSIVTSDPFALQLAKHFCFNVIDNANRSQTDAIELATRLCKPGRGQYAGDSRRYSSHQSWELETILQSAPTEGSVLVCAADGRGTNAIWRRPAGLFPARFGNDSFAPHHAAAQATGKPCVVLPARHHSTSTTL
jgi:2-phospho-L-lactate guanylyltransferase (CobY/MobA/RfbA family)